MTTQAVIARGIRRRSPLRAGDGRREEDPLPVGDWTIKTGVFDLPSSTTTRMSGRGRGRREGDHSPVGADRRRLAGSTRSTSVFTAAPSRRRWPHAIARLRADDQLGRDEAGGAGHRRDASEVAMTRVRRRRALAGLFLPDHRRGHADPRVVHVPAATVVETPPRNPVLQPQTARAHPRQPCGRRQRARRRRRRRAPQA